PCDETTWAQFCGAAEMRYESGPEIDGAAAPGLYLAGVVHVVEDGANGSGAGDGQRLLHHFACGIGRRHSVIVEQPDIVGVALICRSCATIAAAGEAKVPAGPNQGDPGVGPGDPLTGIICRAVIDNNNLEVGVVLLTERIEACNSVLPAVPVDDDADK